MSAVYLLSLGCDKNRVDGEVMVGSLRLSGFEVVNNPGAAEAIIINTCGFISDAVQESLDTIFELAEHKKSGACRALVIVGCMAERYKNEISEKIPEADAIIGVGEYEGIAEVLSDLIGAPAHGSGVTENLRILARSDSATPHIAYVKIAEGCDNRCAYCTIPQIRGAYKSRPREEIIEECRALVQGGAVEIVIVAQDTASYGADIYGAKKLPELLREISETSGAKWIRLMYVYPEHITAALVDTIAELPQICKYIDMPIQHSEDAVLSRMGRKSGRRELEQLIGVLRERIPALAIRTTLMVGFPGETEEDFRAMYDFAREMKFERMGVFPYSQEEGTPAAGFPRQVKEETKQKRLHKLMELQQKIHFKKQRDLVGKTVQVIVDEAGEHYIGRTQGDAYEVDAVVNFTSEKRLAVGDIVSVKIISADDYDLRGAT